MRVLRVAHHGVVDAWRERERRLRTAGVDVHLLSARRWNEGGRDVDLVPAPDEVVSGATTVGHHPNAFAYDPRPVWRLLGENWDLLDLHEEPCSLAVAEVLLLRALRRLRTPYVLYSAQNIDKRYPVPFRWFERVALRGAAGAYVCNTEAGEILARKGLSGPARLLPLGVDVDRFAPRDREAPSGRLRVGYVGRLEPHKGVSTLLAAAAARPAWNVVLVGDGPERVALEREAARLGIADRVDVRGHASQDELPDAYRDLDVVAVTSLPTPGWLEQFCRVAVEAMASGTPVVATRSGAIPDVVGDAALLVTPADADDLARAVDEATSPDGWARLRSAGLDRARLFTWGAVAKSHLDLYAEVLGRHAASRPIADPHVLVVAYGPPTLLEGCLASLRGALCVTVVDNSSLPGTREVALRHGARYVDTGVNLGFAGGVNLGLRVLESTEGPGVDVLLLNPDARVSPEAVRAMQERAHASPRTACVGATQVDPATGTPARVFWPFPTPVGAWVEAVGLGRLRRRCDFVIGSLLLLRADALADVGPLDERYFLYSEETDWQKSARARGWEVAVAEVTSTHVGAGTGGDPTVREIHFHASLERFVRKHHGRHGWLVFRSGMLLGAAVRALVLPGPRGAAAARRRSLYATGPVAAAGGRR